MTWWTLTFKADADVLRKAVDLYDDFVSTLLTFMSADEVSFQNHQISFFKAKELIPMTSFSPK